MAKLEVEISEIGRGSRIWLILPNGTKYEIPKVLAIDVRVRADHYTEAVVSIMLPNASTATVALGGDEKDLSKLTKLIKSINAR